MSELKPSRRELLYNRLRAFKRMVRSGAECGIDELTEECEAIESIYRTPDTAPTGEIDGHRCSIDWAHNEDKTVVQFSRFATNKVWAIDKTVYLTREQGEALRASLTPTEPCGTCGSPDTEREGDTLCCNSCGVVRDRPLGTPTEQASGSQICNAFVTVGSGTHFYDCETLTFDCCTFYSDELTSMEILEKVRGKVGATRCLFLGKDRRDLDVYGKPASAPIHGWPKPPQGDIGACEDTPNERVHRDKPKLTPPTTGGRTVPHGA